MRTLVLGGVMLALALVLSLVLWSWASKKQSSGPDDHRAAAEALHRATTQLAPPETVDSVLDPVENADVARAGGLPNVLDAQTEVSGRVQPVDGCSDDEVDVFVFTSAVSRFEFDEIQDGETHSQKPDGRMLARARVDLEGRFTARVPEKSRHLWLHARGRYVFTDEPLEIDTQATTPIVMTPECGACIEGRIEGPLGSGPVTESIGVEITAAMDTVSLGTRPDNTQRKTWTGENLFSFRGVKIANRYDLELAPEAYPALRSTIEGLVAGRTQRVDLRLMRGGTLSGRVVDADGAPVADADVRALRPGRWFGFDNMSLRKRKSGADGTFELPAVMVGKVNLSAEKNGLLAEKPLELEVADGATLENLVVRLGLGHTISGVVSWSDGSPAVGVDVRVEFDPAQMFGMTALNAARGARGSTVTDAGGNFVVSGLGAGPFLVTAEALKGGAAAAADLNPSEKRKLLQRARKDDVKPDTQGLALVLAPATVVRGRVVDAAGAPVTEYEIVARSVGTGLIKELGQESVRESVQDENGNFLVALPRSGDWKLVATGETYAPSDAFELALPLATDHPEIVITLQKAAIVRGTVVDQRGVRVGRATVEIATGEPGWMRAFAGTPRPKAESNPDGSFELTGMKPGQTSLFAAAKDYAKSVATPVDLTAGGEIGGVVLTLRDGGRLTGEVYDGGKPAASMLIQATLTSTYEQAMGFSDSSGRFELKHLEPGSYQIVAMRTGALGENEDGANMDAGAIMSKLKMASAEIVEGQDAHVVLGAPPSDPVHVHGRVTLAGGTMAGAMIVFIGESKDVLAGMKTATIGNDDSYSVDLDGPGHYAVTVQRFSSKPGEQSSVEFPCDIPTVKEYKLDLAMPDSRISGRVIGPDGAPAAGVAIGLTSEAGVLTGSTFGGQFVMSSTDKDGRYDLTAIQPGVYSVAAGGSPFGGMLGESKDFGRATNKNIRVGRGEWRKDVDFRLEKPGTVVVTVVDADDRPVAEASVFARDGDGHVVDILSTRVTGPDGTVSYGGLAAGKYTFSARGEGRASAESTRVDVEAGATKTAKVTLASATILIVKVVDEADKAVAAHLTVVDSAGREVANMMGMRELQARFSGASTSRDEQRLGPLVAGKYRVRAERADGKAVEKPVTLSGQAERTLKLTFDGD
ncbi:MAG: carboxypeptidase regulatory-like domain-containing protein [Planctomycetes bacterium]|nr:carboxypeptidase regulatory-like domain-containing protein [Planctomycetota bacterium]